ncbi:hypothetical protein [Metabacillus fastidiosus]|uniref:hypothetical protein n=1 Tax=Metabacillus fastidiosus TaxID=1458 RepID=UPI002E20D89F|nr:hypothetical protein [Metabacillus fastidiosus]
MFEVKDNNGKDVAVKEIAVLDVGETEATITFVRPLTANPAGTWTVNVAFDADAQAVVEAVKGATNEVALLNALNSSYFKDVNEDLISKYAAEDFSNAETVADVQKIIDEVNKDNVSADAVKKVNEAKNQVELLKALQDGGFARVNANLIATYATHNASEYKTAPDADAVQAIIDTVNKTAADDAVDAADTTLATALTAKAIADAQVLVDALPEKEDADKTAKKALQDRLDVANAVAKVKAATTQASLLSALKSPVLKLENIDDKLAKFYKAEFDAEKANITTAAFDLQGEIVDAGKDAAIADAVEKIDRNTDKTSTADLKALLTEHKRLNPIEFTEDIVDALVEDYKTDILTAIDTAAPADTTEVNTIIETANDPAAALAKVVTEADKTADDLLKALKAKTLNLKNVKDANKNAYLADKGLIKTEAGKTVADLQKAVNTINLLADANSATTATAMQTALTGIAVNQSVTSYVNLSSAAKLEVAELVLAAHDKETGKKFADVDALAENNTTGVLGVQTKAYTDFLAAVNGATDIGGMKTALDKVELPTFQELDAEAKVTKAEAVLNKLEELKALETPSSFKTIAEVKVAAGL